MNCRFPFGPIRLARVSSTFSALSKRYFSWITTHRLWRRRRRSIHVRRSDRIRCRSGQVYLDMPAATPVTAYEVIVRTDGYCSQTIKRVTLDARFFHIGS
jgi:hypothetical protein